MCTVRTCTLIFCWQGQFKGIFDFEEIWQEHSLKPGLQY